MNNIKNITEKLRLKKDTLLFAAGNIFIFFSFVLLDLWLRYMTRWIDLYSIYSPAPNIFTLLWAAVLTSAVTLPRSRKAGRIVYGITYGLFALYAVIQYSSSFILGKFLYLSEFLLAGEGADYASWVVSLFTPVYFVQIFFLIATGVIGIIIYPKKKISQKKFRTDLCVRGVIILIAILCMIPVPKLYGESVKENAWDGFGKPSFEYDHFSTPNFDMQLTGLYQFLVRDISIQLGRKPSEEDIQMIDSYFDEKSDHSDNEMTGIFEGKNVIVFMMETMDDWLITPEDTPTIYKMMTEGINFTNFYTPQYSGGYTFNTEFAFNTSVYPYSNGNVTYALARSDFRYSIANIFSAAGYTAESFHAGSPSFYNRENMHKAWGYEKYGAFYSYYCEEGLKVQNDRFLASSDALYADLTSDSPFFSFVITYSPHLPYSDDHFTTQMALEAHPEYDVSEDREVAVLRAKARLTDDMFAQLLSRLEEDGILDDTVIVGFGDHYAYGLSDKTLLQSLSEEAGSSILERTPAFIYCSSLESPVSVDKVSQITDLAPTVLNLFGFDVPTELMGNDIFDDSYSGYVIFANNTWLTEKAYVKYGSVVWNNGMTDEELTEMNRFVQNTYLVNDAILDSDYYSLQN